ncbi:triple tyrosine motif-containing protein [Bacillus sp. DX1.1]|uniref:triple tyrosine motif-containing protein n=1 Tax=Bacillus sp. DX1.1 TaxID=3055866 RepID=UPI0025A26937|nr:triple tyrosine motif-containing protein [Bacillus sp. DX1.1]MDM5157395.1 triple tyrosine motif-containing protein [Bacillus sp. DX1.1]
MIKKLILPFIAVLLILSGCGKETTQETSKKNVNQEKKADNLKIENVTIQKIDDQNLKVGAKATGDKLQYAYYIYKGDEVVEKMNYKPENSLTYKVKESGDYKVKVFVKDKNNKIEAKSTSVVKMGK